MATVRIYKVAELLGTTSQEVIELLNKQHGIVVKSASSTIEEVVARQFVERQARERGLAVPGRTMFEDKPAAKKGKRAAKAVEPPKPAARKLPPPRLIKSAKLHKPELPPEEAPEAAEPTEVETPAAVEAPETVEAVEAVEAVEPVVAETAPAEPEVAEPAATVDAAPISEADAIAEPATAEAEAAEEAAPVAATEAIAEPGEDTAPAAAAPPPAPRRSVLPKPTGRVVPPTLRLRIEDPKTRAKPKPPLTPRTPHYVRPPAPIIKPPVPGQPLPGQRMPAPPRSQMPLGGPRPLPSQPVRTPVAGRPMPTYRPPQRRPSGGRRTARPSRPAMPAAPAPPPPVTRSITLAEGMTVKDLADKLDVRAKDVLKKLLERRMMMTINTTLDTETATMIAREFGADVQMRSFEEELHEAEEAEVNVEDLVTRAPVVTVMGHVDHGKTTLLDGIRETRVAEREAGGITQHIGAYAVDVNDRKVVFLDTPGHEAFTMMRARGARVTDVVVLVVAADDGVMPQTREAIDHSKAAGVPILVAINKIDKPDANPDRVKKELADLGLVPEAWGGQTVMVEVSAKKRENLEGLLEMVLLVTEMGELKANPKRNATGTVLEAKLDRGRGPVATVLVQDGTLAVGDTFIAGVVVGKVRALIDDRGRQTKEAGPSTPVEVLGLSGLPQPGDTFQALTDAAKARQIALYRQTQAKEKALVGRSSRLTLESLQQQIAVGDVKELPIIIKADVQGSAEVLADTLAKLSDDRVKIRIIHAGVGAVNESDVLLASASNAIIIAFSVRPDRNAADVAERESVEIRQHTVIYNVTDEIKKAMVGLLEPTLKEKRLGSAEVRQIFKVPKQGVVAGCMVLDGRITRSGDAQARLLRDNVVVFEGRLASLRRFKDDVSEVKNGFECGIGLERYNDIKVGDVIEVFVVERIAATV